MSKNTTLKMFIEVISNIKDVFPIKVCYTEENKETFMWIHNLEQIKNYSSHFMGATITKLYGDKEEGKIVINIKFSDEK